MVQRAEHAVSGAGRLMDPTEFKKLALAEMPAVYRLAVYLSSAQEAEDLVQETYLRAFRSMHSFKPNEHGIRPWLFKILHNVLYSRLSRDRQQREAIEQLRLDAPASATPETHAQSFAGVSNIDWEQVDSRLRDAVMELPLAHRTTFLLHVEGLRYREIAAITEIPIGTVMSRLCRARAMLNKKLSTLAAEQGINPTERRLPSK